MLGKATIRIHIHVCIHIHIYMYTYVYIYIYKVAEEGNLDAEEGIGARRLAPGGAVAEEGDAAQEGWR